MSKDAPAAPEPNGFFAGGSRRASELAKTLPAIRSSKTTTARSRISVTKTKKTRVAPLGPTPERIAKGDVASPRTVGGFHRSVSMAEQLRDQKQLQKPQSRLSPSALDQLHEKGKLDYDRHTADAMFQAGQRLQRHYEGCGSTIQAQDLNKVLGSTGDDPRKQDAWVFHREAFRTAVSLIGWSDTNPHRGAGRIVVAVVCEGMTIGEAASVHLHAARAEVMQATAVDRLREGLFGLAVHWRMV